MSNADRGSGNAQGHYHYDSDEIRPRQWVRLLGAYVEADTIGVPLSEIQEQFDDRGWKYQHDGSTIYGDLETDSSEQVFAATTTAHDSPTVDSLNLHSHELRDARELRKHLKRLLPADSSPSIVSHYAVRIDHPGLDAHDVFDFSSLGWEELQGEQSAKVSPLQFSADENIPNGYRIEYEGHEMRAIPLTVSDMAIYVDTDDDELPDELSDIVLELVETLSDEVDEGLPDVEDECFNCGPLDGWWAEPLVWKDLPVSHIIENFSEIVTGLEDVRQLEQTIEKWWSADSDRVATISSLKVLRTMITHSLSLAIRGLNTSERKALYEEAINREPDDYYHYEISRTGAVTADDFSSLTFWTSDMQNALLHARQRANEFNRLTAGYADYDLETGQKWTYHSNNAPANLHVKILAYGQLDGEPLHNNVWVGRVMDILDFHGTHHQEDALESPGEMIVIAASNLGVPFDEYDEDNEMTTGETHDMPGNIGDDPLDD